MQLKNVKLSKNSKKKCINEGSRFNYNNVNCIVSESSCREKELYSAWNGRSLIE